MKLPDSDEMAELCCGIAIFFWLVGVASALVVAMWKDVMK